MNNHKHCKEVAESWLAELSLIPYKQIVTGGT